jgi:hypothetical protein
MANFVYTQGKEGIGDDSINMLADDIRVALVSAAYTPNSLTDEFLSSVSGIVARSLALSGKSFTDGVFDAANITVSAVSGVAVTQLVIFKHTGVDATARLIARYDTGTGLPLTPSGADVPITWDNGASKIFAL